MDKILDVFELYADSDKRKVEAFKSKLSSKMSVRIESDKTKQDSVWIDVMENTIEYLDNILRNPMRLIINEEEVVKIEKIKKVTVESIKHLSKNAGFIEDVAENGDVQPGKLLNVFKEETFNTYENRFIYTLIQNMLAIARKEKRKIIEQASVVSKEYRKMDYTASSYNGKNKVDMQLILTSTNENNDATDEKQEVLERITVLEKEILNLTLTSTYQQLEKEHVSLITPPLKKTNMILKNVNFQYAVKLWDFLINEMEQTKDGEIDSRVKEYKERGKSKHYVDETFLLDYLILKNVEHPELRKKYKKEIMEQLIANMVERIIDVNEQVSEEQLKNLVSKQYVIVKYKKQITNKQIQDIFKKHIGKYIKKITTKNSL